MLDARGGGGDVTRAMDVSQPVTPSSGGRRVAGNLLLGATVWVGSMAALIQAVWAPISGLFR